MKNAGGIFTVFVISAILASYRGSSAPTRLHYVTTAHQAGPVGFRDPIGMISPNGVWLAYISNRHLFLHRIEGSSTTELPPADDLKVGLRWFPDSRHLAVKEAPFGGEPRWFSYDIATRKRESLKAPPIPASQKWKPCTVSEKIWGSTVFSPDGRRFYYSIANAQGTLDLWSCNTNTGESMQLTHFDRDTYDPSISDRGDVLFKSQVFSAVLATVPAVGGTPRVLTAFQSETPTWSPDGKNIAFTFGRWRRVIDDALYPNISQDLGTIPFDAESVAQKPSHVIQASSSEDQGMVWSPNGKWIVFHSHRDNTDDLYLQPADGSDAPRQITKGGVETGWPRWSPDGRWIAYSSHPGPYRSTLGKLYVLGVDQNTGQVTQAVPVNIEGQTETVGDQSWMPDSDHIVFDSFGAVPRRKSLAEVSRKGGRARKIFDYASDQDFSGISVAPDGKWVAYVATATDGTYQIFRAPTAGGQAQQVTTDPSHKTQPDFSPDGTRLAFTIWRYDVQFWMLRYEQ
jgi:Tol biopolymer transport system component